MQSKTVAIARDGSLWVGYGAGRGALRIRNGVVLATYLQNQIRGFVNGISEDRSGNIWIAHDEGRVRTWHERAHMQIEDPIRYGSWPGRESSGPGFGEKDIVVAVRARRGIRHLFVRGTSPA